MVYRRLLHVSTALLAAALGACGAGNVPSATSEAAPTGRPDPRAGFPAPANRFRFNTTANSISASTPRSTTSICSTRSASVVAQLHAMGRRVMCYVDVGTWEKWRPDAGKFPKSVLGNPDGHWKGERWLDVRQTAILEPIMAHRLELCKRKGFDGVDPDNLDGYENKTGFPLTYADQLTLRFVGRESGARARPHRRSEGRQRPSQRLGQGLRLRRHRAVLRAGMVQAVRRLHPAEPARRRRRVRDLAAALSDKDLPRHGSIRRDSDSQEAAAHRVAGNLL